MPHQITIKPSEHSFACDDGETVLAAAMRADLMIPYGCRNGACGTCKSHLLEGVVDYGHFQPGTLTDTEKRQGYALLCVARPQTDLVVEVREVRKAGDIRIRKLPCRIEKIDKVAADVAIVSLKLPANDRLQYLAGQYVDFLLKDGRRRSFSIATAPEDDALLDLHVRHVPGGHFSGQLFNEFKGREILRIEGPLGNFFFCGAPAALRLLRQQGTYLVRGRPPKVAFLRPGQGGQYLNMLKSLASREPVVRAPFDEPTG